MQTPGFTRVLVDILIYFSLCPSIKKCWTGVKSRYSFFSIFNYGAVFSERRVQQVHTISQPSRSLQPAGTTTIQSTERITETVFTYGMNNVIFLVSAKKLVNQNKISMIFLFFSCRALIFEIFHPVSLLHPLLSFCFPSTQWFMIKTI